MDLVIVLKPGLSLRDYARFAERTLTRSGKYDEHGSFRHPEGVQAIMKSKADGRDVVLIVFFSNATPRERSDLERRILDSPFVESLARNATPEEAVVRSNDKKAP